MHGAGAALGDAASELRAGETEVVAQHPQERRVWRDVHGLAFAVDGEDDRGHDALRAEGVEKAGVTTGKGRSEEHTSELQSRLHLVCRLLLEKKKKKNR